jgi:hypothetical protein
MELAIIALGLAALLGLMYFISRSTSKLNRKDYQKRWSKINKTFGMSEEGMRLAIIDADKLLDKAMKQSGVRGDSMGERLKNAKNIISGYQNVWDAHKLRNRLVHEEVSLKKSQATRALGAFKKALKSMGAL